MGAHIRSLGQGGVALDFEHVRSSVCELKPVLHGAPGWQLITAFKAGEKRVRRRCLSIIFAAQRKADVPSMECSASQTCVDFQRPCPVRVALDNINKRLKSSPSFVDQNARTAFPTKEIGS